MLGASAGIISKAPSLTGLMVAAGCQWGPQLGSDRTYTPLFVVIFFTAGRLRFLTWYLRVPEVSARRDGK